MTRTASFAWSIKTAWSMPLLKASIPKAPLPANKSKQRPPSKNGPSRWNIASFNLSPVGLVCRPLTVFKVLPLHSPAITRIFLYPLLFHLLYNLEKNQTFSNKTDKKDKINRGKLIRQHHIALLNLLFILP